MNKTVYIQYNHIYQFAGLQLSTPQKLLLRHSLIP